MTRLVLDPFDVSDDGYVRTPSGLILPEDLAEEQMRMEMRPRAMDFFSGCGGFSLGMIGGGFEVVAASEWEPAAMVTYVTNLCRFGEMQWHFVENSDSERLEKYLTKRYRAQGIRIDDGEIVCDEKFHGASVAVAGSGWIAHQPRSTPSVSHLFFGDIAKLTSKRILTALGMKAGELDCVFGSPPCQGYSVANRNRRPDDPRNNLTFEYARMVVELRPKSMMMENVPQIATMMSPDGVPVIEKFCRILEDGSFGPYDALMRSLEAQSGAVALMRGRRAADKERCGASAKQTRVQDSAQIEIFGDAA